MVNLAGKHGSENGMAQVIVALVSCEICKQVLNGMIDMLLGRNFLIVPVLQRLAVFLSAIFSDFGSCKDSMRREKVKGIGRCRLSASKLVGFGGHVGLYAGNDGHSTPSFASSLSKQSALHDSIQPLQRASANWFTVNQSPVSLSVSRQTMSSRSV